MKPAEQYPRVACFPVTNVPAQRLLSLSLPTTHEERPRMTTVGVTG